MEKRITKKDYFATLREIVADNAELVAFIDREVELLSRKRSTKGQTKTQKENEGFKEVIMAVLTDLGRATVTEILNDERIAALRTEKGEALSSQKVSALMKQLKDADMVGKETEKGKSYFSVIA